MSVVTTVERSQGATADDDLVRLAAAGDQDAFAELYDRHGHVSFGLALRIIGDRQRAEDAVQDAFLDVWRSAPRFDADRGAARAWILAIVHRRAVDVVRREERRRREPVITESDLWSEPANETIWLAAERRSLRDALDRLSVEHREVLLLAYYGGLTQSEIATRLQLPLGTVKSRTWAALARLGSLLDDAGDAAEPRRTLTPCSVGGA